MEVAGDGGAELFGYAARCAEKLCFSEGANEFRAAPPPVQGRRSRGDV